MPIFETALLIKGIIVIGKALAAHSALATTAAKTGYIAVKSYGVLATAQAAASGAVVVGGAAMIAERLQKGYSLVEDLRAGRYASAVSKANSLITDIAGCTEYVSLRDTLTLFVSEQGQNPETVRKLIGTLSQTIQEAEQSAKSK